MAGPAEEGQHASVEALATDGPEQRVPALDERPGSLTVVKAEEEEKAETGEEDREEHSQHERVEKPMSEAEREESLELGEGKEGDFLDVALEAERQQHATEGEGAQVLRGAHSEAAVEEQPEEQEEQQHEGQRVHEKVSEVLAEGVAVKPSVEGGVPYVLRLKVEGEQEVLDRPDGGQRPQLGREDAALEGLQLADARQQHLLVVAVEPTVVRVELVAVQVREEAQQPSEEHPSARNRNRPPKVLEAEVACHSFFQGAIDSPIKANVIYLKANPIICPKMFKF